MKKYLFKPYSKTFPVLFEKEKERISAHITIELLIEHVGSTAVPDLGGKGIIDIAIAAEIKELETIAKQLQELGYEFRASGTTPSRQFFRVDLPDAEEGTRRYHLHLTDPSSKDWKDLIAFRNYLRSHPEEAEKYAELKKRAVFESEEDGEKYRKIKEPIFQEMIERGHKT